MYAVSTHVFPNEVSVWIPKQIANDVDSIQRSNNP